MSGFFLVSHDLASPDHDLHPHSTGEPACRMAAWVDLIGMARWKDGGGLKRGQLAHSERFLAVRWNRPRSWVTRFLDDLEAENRIYREPQAGRKPGHITICNYDIYQDPRTASESTSEPRVGPRIGPRTGPKKKEERSKKKETAAAARVGEFCERTGSEWRLDKGIQEWVDEIQGEPKYAGADIPYEINKCADWHVSKGRSPKAPDISIRNWLERSAKRAKEEASQNGDGPPSWLAGLDTEDGWGNS